MCTFIKSTNQRASHRFLWRQMQKHTTIISNHSERLICHQACSIHNCCNHKVKLYWLIEGVLNPHQWHWAWKYILSMISIMRYEKSIKLYKCCMRNPFKRIIRNVKVLIPSLLKGLNQLSGLRLLSSMNERTQQVHLRNMCII